MAEFLLALADFDRQKLWTQLGYDGLFSFLHRELRLSKAAAFQRKVAAGLLQRFPRIEAPLRDGRLCMTAIAHLAKVITQENYEEVLPRFFGLSSREAEAMAAGIAPRPTPTRGAVVTAVRVSSPRGMSAAAGSAVLPGTAAAPSAAAGEPGTTPVPAPEPAHGQVTAEGLELVRVASCPLALARDDRRPEAKPLTADLHRLHVTVSRRFLDKLRAATEALAHAHPDARAQDVLEAGLDLLLDRAARKSGLVDRPRAKERSCAPGHVPARVRREVWRRDGRRCQWPLESGGVCGSRSKLELDHVVPRALGGPSTVSNMRVVCRFHNLLAARRVFGDRWMGRFALSSLDGPASTRRSSRSAPDMHRPRSDIAGGLEPAAVGGSSTVR